MARASSRGIGMSDQGPDQKKEERELRVVRDQGVPFCFGDARGEGDDADLYRRIPAMARAGTG